MQDRYRGCLLGGAVGDALGAPLEFVDAAGIRMGFSPETGKAGGPATVRRYHPAYGRLGAITDDTQMTLFTAEGLLRAHNRQLRNDLGEVPGAVYRAYLRWYATQMHSEPPPRPDGLLAGVPDLYSRRAPGTTCLSALRAGVMGTPERPVNNSKGCGGVMRVAPVALALRWDAWDLACRSAAITHGHPAGYLASGALALVLARILDGDTLAQAVDAAIRRLRAEPDGRETRELLERAMYAAELRDPSLDQLAQLGEGWIAEEALAMGVYAAAVVEDFEEGVALAVTHGGDSDSTGSIAGQILGTLYGAEAIPADWLDGLELRDLITEVADDLYSHFAADGFEPDEADWGRYPG